MGTIRMAGGGGKRPLITLKTVFWNYFNAEDRQRLELEILN